MPSNQFAAFWIIPNLCSADQPREIDYTQYAAKVAYLPKDIVKWTFQATIQFYRTLMENYLKKNYKSPFPVCNVYRSMVSLEKEQSK